MSLSKDSILETLKTVKYPGFSRDIVSFGLVRSVELSESAATVTLELTTADPTIPQKLKSAAEAALKPLGDIAVQLAVTTPKTKAPSDASEKPPKPSMLAGVKHIVAVASGKGGVGKSTFSVNLATALSRLNGPSGERLKVGLMDCDIYGPSAPLMIGVHQRPEIQGENIVPVENYGIKIMSMGLLIDEGAPVVWRGPMIMKTIQQFANNVIWGELDVLVVDLPPGTGDTQLSLVQNMPISGALIVTTPQTASVNVTRRGARMFEKVNVPILGVAENMSFMENPLTGERDYLFGEDGGKYVAEDLKAELLGQVPFDKEIRIGGDRGIPIIIGNPDASATKTFIDIAQKLTNKLN